MIFPTKVNGIPCLCHVTNYTPGLPATRVDPPEGPEFEYELLDLQGLRAKWLDQYITKEVDDRLFEDFHFLKQEEYYSLRDFA